MKYTKQPIGIPEQLSTLKQRGLIFENEKVAQQTFESISYFRLANYWKIFETDSVTHQLLEGTSLQDITSLYSFDRELRGIVFSAIQDIEIALRTRIIHHFSMSHGAFWFMNPSLFIDESIYKKCLESLTNEVSRSKETFLQEHFQKYDEPTLPPVWKTLEVASFGTLSKLFCNMGDIPSKKKIAKSFGLPQYVYLESWLRSFTVLRNYCAHHARIWNRRFPWKPQLPKRLPLNWIDVSLTRPIKIFAQLSTLLYLEQSISLNTPVKNQLLALFAKQPPERMKAMGFPDNWNSHGLWR